MLLNSNKRFDNISWDIYTLEVLALSHKNVNIVNLLAATAALEVQMSVCLSVCLSVTLASGGLLKDF